MMNFTFIPDWLLPTFLLLPALLWMFLGVGLPYALAVLPRSDWRKPATLIGVALAFGPALVTTAMFFIGTFGQFSAINVLLASIGVATIGVLLATRNRSPLTLPDQNQIAPKRLSTIDWTLIAVIVVAILIRFWNTAYWPYTTYDEFWVYGYNAKLFMLRGAIPSTMGYYPQLLPLAYTYAQLMWGAVNDHAARTVVPIFALASILMAYLLGSRLFNRRVGLITAALWTLFPQHMAWSQFGDLEVPVTLYFTGTVLFFALGWRERNRRYIVLSGLLMGAALWTKPTAGALIESMLLVMIATAVYWLIRQPHIDKLRVWLTSPEARYPLLALCVAVPMGGMWYVRNMLYGLPPLVFPKGYWQLAAQRSGQELGWPLLIAVIVTALLVIHKKRVRAALLGVALMLVGSLPSAFGWRLPTYAELSQLAVGSIPADLKPTPLTVVEWAIIGIGAALLTWAALPRWRALSRDVQGILLIIIAFGLPYFVTWFWSYSYHPRLSFAIVPLLIVLVALALDRLPPLPRRLYVAAVCVVIVALALPGYFAGLTALAPAITGALPDDHARYAQGNPSLMGLVDYLAVRLDPNRRPAAVKRPLHVEVPGELRLPFFFPNEDIRTENYPTRLDQIVGVDFFVDSSVGQRLYNENGKPYAQNQILSSLTRDRVMQRTYTTDDGNFRYSVYTFDNKARFATPTPQGQLNVQVGSFATLIGYDLSNLHNIPGQAILLTLEWQAIGPADLDYSVFVHLWDTRENKLVAQWGGEPVFGAWGVWHNVPGAHINIPYHTRLWQAGEGIKDEWWMIMPQVPPGTYELRAGMYDSVSGKRLPITKNGVRLGDWVKLNTLTILQP
ncbi:MAG: glycosyltransferase family 39 protein [Chloroflexota bacterium]